MTDKEKKELDAKKFLSQFVKKEAIEKVSKREIINLSNFKKGVINYIIFQIQDNEISNIPQFISESIDIVIKNDGCVSNIMSSIVMVHYDFDEKNIEDKVEKVIKNLSEHFKENIKIIYGNIDGVIGTLGTFERLSHGPIIPNLGDKIKQLMNIDFGKRIKCEN